MSKFTLQQKKSIATCYRKGFSAQKTLEHVNKLKSTTTKLTINQITAAYRYCQSW